MQAMRNPNAAVGPHRSWEAQVQMPELRRIPHAEGENQEGTQEREDSHGLISDFII